MSELVTAKKVVSITYLIRDESGEIREYRDVPVAYVHGGRSAMFPRIERALDGRPVGYRATVELTPDEAFGAHDPSLTFTDDIDNVPPELRYLGAELEAENEQGDRRQFRVTKIEDGRLTVDANHPLAGRVLTYEVTVAAIRDANADEIGSGEVQPDLSVLR